MARLAVAALLLIFLAAPATSIDFQVDVAGESGDALFDEGHLTEGDVHRFNASLENPSSVGCEYFLRGEFERGNTTERRYSEAYRMWPGNSVTAEISYVPINYTGAVEANIDLIYCDTVRNVSDYSFDISNPEFNRTYESETLAVTQSSANASFSARNGTLVPVSAPPYWRVGSSDLRNYSAEISYRPTMFQQEEITFAIVENSSVQGKTTVELVPPEPTLKQKILDRKFEIVSVLAVILLLSNLYLLRKRILPEVVFEKLKELETDRSIKR